MLNSDNPEHTAVRRIQTIETALRQLSSRVEPSAPCRRVYAVDAMRARGISPTVALAAASVPRAPFLPNEHWRLADTVALEHPQLPATVHLAALFEAAGLTEGSHLVLVEKLAGWSTVVGGVLAALYGGRAATTAQEPLQQAELSHCLRGLRIKFAIRPAQARTKKRRAFVIEHRCERPPQEWINTLADSECLVWRTPETAIGPSRIRRLQLRSARFALTDLGETL